MVISGILAALNVLTANETNYGQHKGARLFVRGMDYHYRNYMRVAHSVDDYEWHHESVAYLNRLGQLYYYLISDAVNVSLSDIPLILTAIKFRMKYSAHRQVDAPRKGDILADHAGVGGTVIHPLRKFQAFEIKTMADFHPGITLPFREDDNAAFFFLSEEHPYLMAEALRVLAKKASALTSTGEPAETECS